ncbi:MAG: BLUF domain-containing protein [Acidiferrobacterales bacterium]|nr:BLUF domain-containing protein [Acidiferrobacterales bacterium]
MRAVIFCCEASNGSGASTVPYSHTTLSGWQTRFKKYRVNGILTYTNGRFLHFIEGRKSNIRRALYSAFTDPGYNHFDYCLNAPASSRTFKSWRMVRASQLRNDKTFIDFINTHQGSISPPRDSYQAISSLAEKNRLEILLN